jgi:hypothetical protein
MRFCFNAYIAGYVQVVARPGLRHWGAPCQRIAGGPRPGGPPRSFYLYICTAVHIYKFFGVAGGPLNRGAPCHGIIGILVNPALVVAYTYMHLRLLLN